MIGCGVCVFVHVGSGSIFQFFFFSYLVSTLHLLILSPPPAVFFRFLAPAYSNFIEKPVAKVYSSRSYSISQCIPRNCTCDDMAMANKK